MGIPVYWSVIATSSPPKQLKPSLKLTRPSTSSIRRDRRPLYSEVLQRQDTTTAIDGDETSTRTEETRPATPPSVRHSQRFVRLAWERRRRAEMEAAANGNGILRRDWRDTGISPMFERPGGGAGTDEHRNRRFNFPEYFGWMEHDGRGPMTINSSPEEHVEDVAGSGGDGQRRGDTPEPIRLDPMTAEVLPIPTGRVWNPALDILDSDEEEPDSYLRMDYRDTPEAEEGDEESDYDPRTEDILLASGFGLGMVGGDF
jgi:hypothetical protein